MVLMYFGWEQLDFRFWMGLGVTAYGFTYFHAARCVHSSSGQVAGQTGQFLFPRHAQSAKVHHKKMGKEDGEEFGLLLFNKRHWRQPGLNNSAPTLLPYLFNKTPEPCRKSTDHRNRSGWIGNRLAAGLPGLPGGDGREAGAPVVD